MIICNESIIYERVVWFSERLGESLSERLGKRFGDKLGEKLGNRFWEKLGTTVFWTSWVKGYNSTLRLLRRKISYQNLIVEH